MINGLLCQHSKANENEDDKTNEKDENTAEKDMDRSRLSKKIPRRKRDNPGLIDINSRLNGEK